jgi:RNA polymerase sigma-70 factor (ECF subfamily)
MDDRRDEVLMMQFRDQRDPRAMVTLFRRHHQAVFRYLVRRTGSADRAQDLAQEVFAALIDGAARYRPAGSFQAYLFRIARNLSAKEWRGYRRRVQLEREPAAAAPAAAERIDGARQAAAVRRALAGLDDEQREPIMLREYQGLSYAEIAEVLGVPAGTVKSRIARGKLALRRLLLEPDAAPAVQEVAR